jgi:hypothetical protein
MKKNDERRVHNPFHDPLVTELIEDPNRYHQMFSEEILVGETTQVFQPTNVVLVGPQGSGKSMILNLIRYSVISKWISDEGSPPEPLREVTPYFGISINLVRANFHAFGRRSVSKARSGQMKEEIEATCAADFLTHYLFREFLKGIVFLQTPEGNSLISWLGIKRDQLDSEINNIATWDSWFGYYKECNSLEAMLEKCEHRLSVWRSFLNANIDEIPADIWESKALMEDSLHSMGNLLRSAGRNDKPLSLFVVIDQYEVLPELNLMHGQALQRIVNTLIKTRDPVVFYKIGARTYDWGEELRIWGAKSRIEVQRDYVMINLADILMRNEDGNWLFPKFAADVAFNRMKQEFYDEIKLEQVHEIFGIWDADFESRLYFRKRLPSTILRRVSGELKKKIEDLCGISPSPLELRLAEAWVMQKQQRRMESRKILRELKEKPWHRTSWHKERVGNALLQIASLTNQKRRYFGWKTLMYLSGANISAFLLLCSEVWDHATKMDINPLERLPLPPPIQSEGILEASEKWRNRDRNEHIGGRKRWEVLSRLGPGIHDAVVEDLAISNPGHSGFSIRESELLGSEEGAKVARFLQDAVSWAIFEERSHSSRLRESGTRRKFYLHPLLSPAFAIPYIRSKEPLYVNIHEIYEWIFGDEPVLFKGIRARRRQGQQQEASQLQIPLEGFK